MAGMLKICPCGEEKTDLFACLFHPVAATGIERDARESGQTKKDP
jgi:hypothetical protein